MQIIFIECKKFFIKYKVALACAWVNISEFNFPTWEKVIIKILDKSLVSSREKFFHSFFELLKRLFWAGRMSFYQGWRIFYVFS